MRDGIALVLAWPQTWCKQAGAWYDPLMHRLRISKNHYYRAGHSAIVLIPAGGGECHYFDFGRYHAPFGYGRVRDRATDHELQICTQPVFCPGGQELLNTHEILAELARNPACHGEGPLYASTTPIYFDRAIDLARAWQRRSPIRYGPFILQGTNCSRFVRRVLLAGRPQRLPRYLLRFPLSLTPTPNGNVLSSGKIMRYASGDLSKEIKLKYF